MKKRLVKYTAILIALSALIQFTACGQASSTEEGSSRRINIATATTGGAMYPAGVAVAQLLSEETEFQAAASTSGGSVENVSLLKNGESEIAFIQTNNLEDAYQGVKTFEGQDPVTNLRILTPFQTSYHYLVVRKDANIQSIPDLAGKRYVIGRAGSGGATTAACILEAWGMTTDDVNAEGLGQTEAIEALKNGQADAAMIVGGLPLSQITDLLLTSGNTVEILQYTPEEQAMIHETNPWIIPLTVPAGTYEGQEEDMLITGHIVYLATTEDAFSEEEAYTILDTIYNGSDYLIQSLPSLDSPAFTNPGEYLTSAVPLHPGAERYFQEAGLLE